MLHGPIHLHTFLVIIQVVSQDMAVTATSYANTTRVEPRSNAADGALEAFLKQDFDPVDYLNANIPPLAVGSRTAQSSQYGRSVPLSELNTQLQTMLGQLNAQMTRLSNTLTQLTDEIIRSGGRLAYEVEVLRGDTTGLTDSLDNELRKDIEIFTKVSEGENLLEDVASDPTTSQPRTTAEPEYLEKLRTLTAVRSRLDSVIKVFGDAMAWPVAPSDLSLASSLISISAPESDADSRIREEKGKAFVEQLRNEINDLVGKGNDAASLEAAALRVEQLGHLAEVWKGTAEEKARINVVESLQRPIEERQRIAGQSKKGTGASAKALDYRYGDLGASASTTSAVSEDGFGFLQNLRNFKNDMYLD
ncbi:hypothetical protein LTR78_009835 [Recurvomyces mirabilis]|uniref:Uncharacterized protein n=1 Tax=Recurvomyces mirabilis TaxID=574656 RepID=A0AAE0WF96_9PEZI|nr:hypothetical protein LTR78_009835 [Recurvomyces mirabilis]KAK5153071.1 hypothetical protein LTS14_007715 [Recurvomyces mirabilis]